MGGVGEGLGPLARKEIERHDWRSLRDAHDALGDHEMSALVPDSLRDLLCSQTSEDAHRYYWDLENVIVVQGQLYEAAVPAVSVLMAGLLDGVAPEADAYVLELVYQLVAGESAEYEVSHGNPYLGEACRAAAREGLWLLYRDLPRKRLYETIRAIIEIVEPDKSRLAYVLESIRPPRRDRGDRPEVS
jgi:hypothetical protein